jgi:hypothetical protein
MKVNQIIKRIQIKKIRNRKNSNKLFQKKVKMDRNKVDPKNKTMHLTVEIINSKAQIKKLTLNLKIV